jgi:RNA polymerase sigma-70 factor, ECF subfamily
MLNTLDDNELIAEIGRRNMAAFRILYYRHVDSVYGLVSRLIGNSRLDVEDLVQEIFIQVHRSLGKFQGNASFATWLHRVAVNVCCTHLRKRSTFGEVPDKTGTPEQVMVENREARLDARRKLREMFALIEGMSLENRTVFVLYELQGATLAEIAEILEVPIHTAASRLRRSREYLMRAVARTGRSAEGGV